MSPAHAQHTRLITALPHVLLFGLTSWLLGLAELRSPRFARLLQEDGWAEWATFLAFAAAAALALHSFRSARGERWLTRWSGLALGLFCLFVAGEEISWGQRIFGFRPPNYFLEQNYQQEANLHNLLKDVLDTRYMVMAIALLYGVLAPFLAHVSRFPAALAAQRALLPWFAAVAWLEFSYPYELVGEFAELLLGLLFVLDLEARATQASPEPTLRASALQAAALAGAVLLVPLNDVLFRWNAETYARAAREDLNALEAGLTSGRVLGDKLLRKKHVHKRIYTAVQAGYLRLDPKRHYLDPWNNPYWIAFQRTAEGERQLLLYSFGPNRRRDTQLSESEAFELALEGDDVGVIVSLEPNVQAQR